MNPISDDAATPDKAAALDAGSTGSPRPARRGWLASPGRALGAATVVLSFALAACQNLVAESGLYYNAGLADSFNGLLLANIIRSAKGEPTYFSAIGDYSASTSTSNSNSLSADVPFNPVGQGSLSVSVGPSRSRDRSANVSSLETKDFAQSMHTVITPSLLFFLVEGSAGVQLNLVLALVTEEIAIAADEFGLMVRGAVSTCNTRFASLSGAERGVCRNFSNVLAHATCAGTIAFAGASLIRFRNDPTNSCEYARFRLFAEAMAINPPRLELGTKGDPVFTLGDGTSKRRLFGTKGAGFLLRSPNEVIEYLGEIVRQGYKRGAVVPRLTTRDGDSVPIFVVKSGADARGSQDTVRVGRETYAVPQQRLGSSETDFSYRALAIVKDLLTLNTSQSQLPKNPTIVVGGAPSSQ